MAAFQGAAKLSDPTAMWVTTMTGTETGTGVSDPQQAFSRQVAESGDQLARIQQLRTATEQVSVTETSADGMVTVVVDGSGVLTDLKITDTTAPGARIAAEVLSTMRRAQARLAGRVREVIESTIGDDPATMDRVTATYRDRFPEPPADEPARPDQDTVLKLTDDPDDRSAPPPVRPTPPATTEQGDTGWDEGDSFIRRY
jgi:DNA-binding protein YbaB